MKTKFDEMREQIDKLEKEFIQQELESYKKKKHKNIKIGDWVSNGNDIGIVAWKENKSLNLKENEGFFGLDIKNNQGGFRAPCRIDDYELVNKKIFDYFTKKHKIELELTGEQIEDLLMRHINWSSCGSVDILQNTLKNNSILNNEKIL